MHILFQRSTKLERTKPGSDYENAKTAAQDLTLSLHRNHFDTCSGDCYALELPKNGPLSMWKQQQDHHGNISLERDLIESPTHSAVGNNILASSPREVLKRARISATQQYTRDPPRVRWRTHTTPSAGVYRQTLTCAEASAKSNVSPCCQWLPQKCHLPLDFAKLYEHWNTRARR